MMNLEEQHLIQTIRQTFPDKDARTKVLHILAGTIISIDEEQFCTVPQLLKGIPHRRRKAEAA